MKKYLILLFIPLSLFSQDNLVKTYEDYLLRLDKTKYYAVTTAIIKYQELFTNSNIDIQDKAFVTFNEFYNKVHDELNNSSFDYNIFFEDYSKKEMPEFLIKYKKDLSENGFEIAMGEMPYLKRNYFLIHQKFSTYLSSEMKSYLLKLGSYESEGTVIDGVLVIAPIRLAERLVELDNFINSNPDFLFQNECILYKKYFFTLLIKGLDNTSVLDDENKLNENFKNAYFFILSEYPETQIGKLVREYYNVLKLRDINQINNLIEDFQKRDLILVF